MTPNQMLKKAIADTGKTQKELTEELGLKSAASLTNYMKSDVRISTFINLLGTLGYTVSVEKGEEKWTLSE